MVVTAASYPETSCCDRVRVTQVSSAPNGVCGDIVGWSGGIVRGIMDVVLLACSDLMTTSRLAGDGLELRRCGGLDAVVRGLAEHPAAAVVIDLQSYPDLPRELHELSTADPSISPRGVVAFAPHVRAELLEAARPWSDVVVSRGAVIKRLAALVDRARARADAR